ncbi:MAG: ABC transporter permease [Terrimicrobiaceae bacterium]
MGIVLSPEYICQIRPGEIFPDNKRFGVLWMGHTDLAAAYDLQGAFNNVAIALRRDASEQEVLKRLDDLIVNYGGQGAFGREEQISHRLVSDELTQLRAMALISPSMFLAVAAFLLNVVLGRLMSTQRDQIAVLKAFGYRRAEVGLHFAKLAMLIVTAGTILGTFAGAMFGHGMTEMYTNFFRFPPRLPNRPGRGVSRSGREFLRRCVGFVEPASVHAVCRIRVGTSKGYPPSCRGASGHGYLHWTVGDPFACEWPGGSCVPGKRDAAGRRRTPA